METLDIRLPVLLVTLITFIFISSEGECCSSSTTSITRTQTVPGTTGIRARAFIFMAVPGGLPNAAPIGTMDFVQAGGAVAMSGTLNGLTPGTRGWHVHTTGDIGNGCDNAGGHFNPFNMNHGAPTAAVRHVGDFGNLVTPASGITSLAFTDDQVSLTDPIRSIVGRAIVIHSMPDDLGLGGNAASLANGNSGMRIACGVIGIFLNGDVGYHKTILVWLDWA